MQFREHEARGMVEGLAAKAWAIKWPELGEPVVGA